MTHPPEYFITELNDGLQWLTDGQDFGISPAAVPDLLAALEDIARGLTMGDKARGDTLEDKAHTAIEDAKGEQSR